ncbi:hypothetical protein INR49_002684 [Caranx melampygus]|nr:hypothetical protein INR49_002684 [Caranx melampygus]
MADEAVVVEEDAGPAQSPLVAVTFQRNLRACLGMEIVACGASLFNMICNLSTQSHFYAECVVIQAVLLAISATLAAYCCKVINCCAPDPKVPVITVQSPPAPQQ